MTTTTFVAAGIYALLGLVCLLLTLVTLPGNWLLVLLACCFQIWSLIWGTGAPPLFSWWTIAVGLALAVLGEVLETGMSAAGAAATGARGRGIWGAVIGSIVGALVGLVFFWFIPIVGSLLGAMAGAAGGAFVGELTYKDRKSHEAAYAAVGAAAGRAAGIMVKLGIGVAIWVLFVSAALWN